MSRCAAGVCKKAGTSVIPNATAAQSYLAHPPPLSPIPVDSTTAARSRRVHASPLRRMSSDETASRLPPHQFLPDTQHIPLRCRLSPWIRRQPPGAEACTLLLCAECPQMRPSPTYHHIISYQILSISPSAVSYPRWIRRQPPGARSVHAFPLRRMSSDESPPIRSSALHLPDWLFLAFSLLLGSKEPSATILHSAADSRALDHLSLHTCIYLRTRPTTPLLTNAPPDPQLPLLPYPPTAVYWRPLLRLTATAFIILISNIPTSAFY